jgi:hypothetical protein
MNADKPKENFELGSKEKTPRRSDINKEIGVAVSAVDLYLAGPHFECRPGHQLS